MPLINFSGLASGIDTNALIDAVTSATRTQRESADKRRITELTDQNTALADLKTKLTDLQSKSLKFTTLNGGVLSKLATSSNESISTATASNSASNGTYTITTSQLAKNASFSFDDRFSATSSIINSNINNGASEASRTLTLTIGTGDNESEVSVVLDNTTTIDQLVSSINAAGTQATAELVNVGTSAIPSYAIVINGVNPGLELGQIALSVGSEITTAGAGALTSDTLASGGQAQDALVSVSGITGTITRPSNSIADIIPGVTLDLVAIGAATIKIGDDVAATTATVQDFIDSFNDLVTFIAENNLITRDESGAEVENVFSALAKTSTDDNSLTAIRNAISASTYSSGTTVRIFADLGITTQRDGTLKFDTNTFSTAISSDPNGVRQVMANFGDTAAVTAGTIDQFIRFNGVFDISINGNKTEISDLNRRIAETEVFIKQQEDSLRQRYANLESTIGKMQSQQQSLTSALAGLNR